MRRFLPLPILLALLLVGCSESVGLGSDSFVSVEIHQTSLPTVRSAAIDVFQRNGFQLVRQTERSLDFRKWGGSSAEFVYGGYNSPGVQVLADVIITSMGPGSFRVHCDVTMHEDRGGGGVDRTWNLKVAGKSAYRGLLKQVKAQAEGRG